MPSLTSTALPLALALANVAFGQFPSCPGAQLSCSNTTAVTNTCCFNAPGGQLLQTQFWDTSPSTGPSNSWTVHGLWPDHCDGTYSANCDASRAYTNITQILQSAGQSSLLAYMNQYWVDEGGNNEQFWEHEWAKHGTCISTLDPSCYGSSYTPGKEVVDFFTRTVSLFKTLDSYSYLEQAGIVPSSTQTYSLSAINSALAAGHSGKQATVQCVNGAIDEIWYTFYVQGSVTDGTFVPATPVGSTSNCPATVKYLPKSGSPAPTSTPTARDIKRPFRRWAA